MHEPPVPPEIPALTHVSEWDCIGDCSVPNCHEPARQGSGQGRPPTRCERHYRDVNAQVQSLYGSEPYASSGAGHFRGTRDERWVMAHYASTADTCDWCGSDGPLEWDHWHGCERHSQDGASLYCPECVRGRLCGPCNKADKLGSQPVDASPFQVYRGAAILE